MKVHIVCTVGNQERILPRLGQVLVDGAGWTMSPTADPTAGVNYWFPYLEVKNGMRRPDTLHAALFTHLEDIAPGKVRIWNYAAEEVDLRVSWPNQYVEGLSKYGPTAAIVPPLDRDHFTPRGTDRRRGDLRAGVSGFTYSGGRKGEELLSLLLKTIAGREFEWSAIGRGWPMDTKSVKHNRLPDFYRDLDVFVCTSTIEGIPYGPLEALACGVPVIIPRGVGMLDSLPDMPGVYRYDAGDIEDLSFALQSFALQPDNWRANELRDVTERFSAAEWVRGHQEAFEKLVLGGSP